MRGEAIARNYADTLFTLAQRNGGAATAQQFGAAAEALAELVTGDARVRAFLVTPRVSTEEKKEALRAALGGRVPDLFLRFVMVVVDKRRQGLLPEIAEAYRGRLDEMLGRVRAQVTLSHAPDAKLQAQIQQALEARTGRPVLADFRVDPELLGGLVVRVGDEVLDASVRSRAAALRRRLQEADIPSLAAY